MRMLGLEERGVQDQRGIRCYACGARLTVENKLSNRFRRRLRDIFGGRAARSMFLGGLSVLVLWLVLACGSQPMASGDPVVFLDLRTATRAPAIHGRVEVGHLSLLTGLPGMDPVAGGVRSGSMGT